MPLPKPHKGESRRSFISRCMASDVMQSEYEQEQRFKVCQTQWEDAMKANISAPTEFKADDSDENVVHGYASVFDNVDEQADRVKSGAFKKTISERIKKGLVKLFDSHNWSGQATLGTIEEATETDRGLKIKARLSSAPDVQAIKQKMIEGHISRMSIGYEPVQVNWTGEKAENGMEIRELKEIKLLEVSAVPIAANESAVVTGVKAVTSFQDLPLASRDRDWDASAAVDRVQSWAGGPDKENLDWGKYSNAFLWRDGDNAEQLGSYKLPIADVIDGTLTAVPRAVFAAAAAVEGARGGVDIPSGEMDSVRSHLNRYYAKMREAFDDDSIIPPWQEESDDGKAANLAQTTLHALPSDQRKAVLNQFQPELDDSGYERKNHDASAAKARARKLGLALDLNAS